MPVCQVVAAVALLILLVATVRAVYVVFTDSFSAADTAHFLNPVSRLQTSVENKFLKELDDAKANDWK